MEEGFRDDVRDDMRVMYVWVRTWSTGGNTCKKEESKGDCIVAMIISRLDVRYYLITRACCTTGCVENLIR